MDAEDALSIGARARKVRTRRGLSLDVAAGLAGISARWRSQSGCWRTARRHPQAWLYGLRLLHDQDFRISRSDSFSPAACARPRRDIPPLLDTSEQGR